MKIAIPTANGMICPHFGHCENFTIVVVEENDKIASIMTSEPPPHEPGVLPRWLKEQNVDVVIAGGMGQRAQELFARAGIKVVVGVTDGNPDTIAKKYLSGSLQCGSNLCDH